MAITEAICATLVLVPPILIVGHVVVSAWKQGVEPYAIAVFFVADAVFGVSILVIRLRQIAHGKDRNDE